jgi:hypothetical protein
MSMKPEVIFDSGFHTAWVILDYLEPTAGPAMSAFPRLGYGDSALNSSSQYIEIVRPRGQRMQLGGLHRENGEFRRQWRIPKWRGTVDENGHYSFAVPL